MDIHCKVRYGEEFRRFVVKTASFSNLFETVKRLFNLPDGCTLKYKDDEGDLVTMSSDEELLSALEFSSGLLHLSVADPSQPQTVPICEKFGRFGGPHHHGGPHDHHHHGPPHVWGKKGFKREKQWDKREKKWEKFQNKRGGNRNPEVVQKRILWLTKKRDEFQRRANEIQAVLVKEGLLPPDLLHEQHILERKLNGISNRLEKLSLFSAEIDASKGQCPDPESLPDVIIVPKVELSEEEKQKFQAELKEIRENLFRTCFFAAKEAKLKRKFCRSALDNFGGNPESEEGKRLVNEWENSRSSVKENQKVLKSVLRREEELCELLGVEKNCKKMFKEKKEKKEKCHFQKNHCHKRFKHK